MKHLVPFRMLVGTVGLVILISIAMIVAFIFFYDHPLIPLAVLIFLTLLVVLVAYILNNRRVSLLELGVFYTLVIALYGIYPLAAYWFNGFTYLPMNDKRLFDAQPAPEEVASIAWYYVFYLVAFAVAYFVARGRISHRRKTMFCDTGQNSVMIMFCTFLLIEATLLAFQSYVGHESTDYFSTYLRYIELPLWVQQLAKHLEWIAISLKIALLTALVANIKKYRLIIIVWFAVEVIIHVYNLGARTELFLLLASLVVAYDFVVRPLKVGYVITMSVVSLLMFMVFGIIRNAGVIEDLPLLLASNAGEFESIFANAFEINELVDKGTVGQVPMSAYWSDILSFVPQQLLPFEKWNFGTWYGMTFHYKYYEMGGGFAFGVIPESMLGFGVTELIARGLIIGALFAIVERMVANGNTGFWMASFYVWLTVNSYLTFRSGSMILLPKAILGFLPAALTTQILALTIRFPTRVNH